MSLKKIKGILKSIKSTRISIKLTVIYAVMFSLVLLLLNASILFGVKYYLYNQANKQIEDMQTIMSNKLSSQNGQADLESKELFSDVPPRESISIRIVDEYGKILNSTSGFDNRFKLPNDNGKKLKNNARHQEDKERHLVYKNVQVQNKSFGTVLMQIVKDMHNEYDFMKILFAVMAVADFIGIIAAIILGYMVGKRMLKPIDYITKTAENISINNLKERIEVKGPDDELKVLANTFNKMIDRLQDAFNRQTQFVSDASHELRTPIAVIQGYANLLDRWGKDDRTALEKSIYGIKLEAGNMANLIEKLLFLAKGESGQKVVEKKEFYLNELIDEVVKESMLIEESHKITNSSNVKVKILADYKMIKQLLRIFIENSLKFTPEEGTIDISSEANGKEVKISVRDNGIGIPKDEIEKIFDRFYTVDKSRSKELGGTGIGLSIAKWIVNMHQGTIDVESQEGKWTKITVTFKL
ncbi:HAMP domain-containing histidine kinase [Clostridium sp. YIM B02515]|uniref:Signal transduction histidine-protein kinase ArlS n=1 Tax=Clostridium rhizosphaerae TaxID=2803861 RepID=A0ABS1T5D6_9CLOT|nr:ATP-binding protein [Clostridium rhizosphaerae]MBL4934543.1 HAMP domain-containing histidine kinase [Clostridium rhizosphaerae]